MNSKKIYFFINSLVILALVFGIYYNFTKKEKISKNTEKPKKKIEIKTNNEKKDTDGDGLKDWEEILYGTSINNPDTDNDGISDYIEIKNGTNPLSFKNDNNDKINDINNKIKEIKISNLEIEKFKQKLIAKKKDDQLLLKKYKKKNIDIYQQEINRIKKENKLIIKDLNKIATILSLESNVGSYENSKKIKQLFKTRANNKDYKGDINNILNIYKRMSVNFKNFNFESNNYFLKFIVNEFNKNFYSIYEKLKNISQNKNFKSNNDIYIKNIENVLNTRKKIDLFIKSKKIKFDKNDPGQFLEYKM